MRNIVLAVVAALFATPALADKQTAIFAGGCFWSVESDFDKVNGVLATTSGYIGGKTENPTYYDHTGAGHREAVLVEFDSFRVTYDELAKIFFRSIDPTDADGQFCDRGVSYTTAIYAVGEAQLAAAEKARAAAAKELKRKTLATEVLPAPAFWPAEDYHQDYRRKNPARYDAYRAGCARERRVEEVWGASAFYGLKPAS